MQCFNRTTAAILVAAALVPAAGAGAAATSPVVELLGERFYVTKGGMDGMLGVGFNWVNRHVLSAGYTDECGAMLKADQGDNGVAFDPVNEEFWLINGNREVYRYSGMNTEVLFEIPEVFNVPGVGPDTLESPQGLALDMNHVYVVDAGPNLGSLESNAWFKFTRDGTPVSSSKATDFTAQLQPHFDAFGDAVVDGITWMPPSAPFGQGLFLVAVEHSGIQVIDADGFYVDRLVWQENDIPYGEAVPFAFAGIAVDPQKGDLYLVENAGSLMHVWVRLPPEDKTLVYSVFGNHVLLPDTTCTRPLLIPTQGNYFSLTYRDVDGLLWTNEFNSGAIVTIDPRSGKQTTHVPMGVNDVWGMAWDSERDVIYVNDLSAGQLHVLDPTTMLTSPLPNASGELGDMAFNPDDGFIYGVGFVSGSPMLRRIDRDTGIATEVAAAPSGGALTYDRLAGTLVLLGQVPRHLYDVDPSDGSYTLRQANVPGGFEGLASVTLPMATTAVVFDDRGRPASLRAFPNPARSASRVAFTLGRSARVNARVLDPAGRVLRELAGGRRFEVGAHVLEWDGRTGDGRLAAPGLYFIEVRHGSERSVARAAIVH